jgi:hypothetical protein
MHMRSVAVFVVAVLCGAVARADLMIEGGTHDLLPNTVTDIPIYATGDGELVLGLDLYVQIDQGGDDPPVITGLSLDGPDCVFSGITYEPEVFSADSRTWCLNVAVLSNDDAVAITDCLVAWISIDTTGALPGQSFALRLQNVLPDVLPPNGFTSDFADDSLNVTIHDGVLNIVPEPSALAMLAGLGVLLICRQARRYRDIRHFCALRT